MKLDCPYYQSQQCRSCSEIEVDYHQQLESKQNHLMKQLSLPDDHVKELSTLYPPVANTLKGFRNKAKMVALGAAHQPTLGILNHQGEEVSLTDCPLYNEEMQALLKDIQHWIQKAGIPPYNIHKQKGELKYVLLTQNQQGEFLLRLVLRSQDRLAQIQERLPLLTELYPQVQVISFNIQPEHKAILEGPQEIYHTDARWISEELNSIPLCIRPQSFFQTSSALAERLYASASQWALELYTQQAQPLHVMDLFCGVGGFGLTVSQALKEEGHEVSLTGIEISAEAIESAKWSASQIGFENIRFCALDTEQYLHEHQEDQSTSSVNLLIVNPPRRGLGSSICQQVQRIQPQYIIYSSCLSSTLAQDIQHLDQYQLVQAQLFDLFPHTEHYETLSLLQRK